MDIYSFDGLELLQVYSRKHILRPDCDKVS